MPMVRSEPSALIKSVECTHVQVSRGEMSGRELIQVLEECRSLSVCEASN